MKTRFTVIRLCPSNFSQQSSVFNIFWKQRWWCAVKISLHCDNTPWFRSEHKNQLKPNLSSYTMMLNDRKTRKLISSPLLFHRHPPEMWSMYQQLLCAVKPLPSHTFPSWQDHIGRRDWKWCLKAGENPHSSLGHQSSVPVPAIENITQITITSV